MEYQIHRQKVAGYLMARRHSINVAARIRAVFFGACRPNRTRFSSNGLAIVGLVAMLVWGQDSEAQQGVVSISDAKTIEGTDLVFHVRVSSEQATEFDWELRGRNATEGVDYGLQTESTMMIPEGQRDATIVVSTIEDGEAESDETVLVVLTTANGTEVAVGTIVDDDLVSALTWDSPLVIGELAWIGFLSLLVILAKCCIRSGIASPSELRALNLPRGSIRALLAMFAVGSFVIVLVFGGPTIGEYYETILAAFGTLTGSIIGFYFGNRGASTALAAHQSEEIQKLIEEVGAQFGDEGAQAVAVWLRLNPGADLEIVRLAAKDAQDVEQFKTTLDVA